MKLAALAVASAVLAVIPAAHAGIILDQTHSVNASLSGTDPNDSLVVDASENYLGVTAAVCPGDDIHVSGTLNSDPTVEIIETINNTSGFDWSSFNVTLTPDAGSHISGLTGLFVSDSTGLTTKFTNAVATNPVGSTWVLTFGGGTVLNGTSVKLDFTFSIDADVGNDGTGIFGYHVANAPVPEPASLGVLGIGAVLMLRRRKN